MSDRFERDLERMLASGSERVSDATRQELAARRRAALDAADSGSRAGWVATLTGFGSRGRSWWLPAGALAAALLAVFMVRPGVESIPAVAGTSEAIDMDILLADENLELYDDLDFFEWLAAVDDEAG